MHRTQKARQAQKPHKAGRRLLASLCMAFGIVPPWAQAEYNKVYLVNDRPPELEHCDPLPSTQLKKGKQIALALAGGGTKAAAFSMGLLTGLSHLNAFKELGAISSVSGGSYAAFFLYSKWLIDLDDQHPQPVDTVARPYFEDCIPKQYAKQMSTDLAQRLKPLLCRFNPAEGDAPKDNTAAGVPPFQPFMRCRQDVLEGDCNFKTISEDKNGYVSITAVAGVTLASAVPNLVTRTLFDMPLNYAPTRLAYRDGIGTAYGLYPTSPRAYTQPLLAEACTGGNEQTDPASRYDSAFRNCQARDSFVRMQTEGQTFEQLQNAYKQYPDMPAWVLQATNSPNRSLFGWAGVNQQNFDRYVLAMSPFAQCSGHFGSILMGNGGASLSSVDKIGSQLDLLDAVNASAAFLDANQVAVEQPWRLLTALGLHALNLDWGTDIHNELAGSTGRGYVHSALPFPLYYLDSLSATLLEGRPSNKRSAYIRVIDGGNSDDLGAYPLVKAAYPTLLISDQSGDREGRLDDLCRLAVELPRRSTRLHLRLPGLADFDQGCLRMVSNSEPDEKPELGRGIFAQAPAKVSAPNHYPIWAWKHPVILGCLVKDPEQAGCTCSAKAAEQGVCKTGEWHAAQRLVVIKPAVDLARFANEQLLDKDHLLQCGDDSELPCEAAAYVLSRKPLNEATQRAKPWYGKGAPPKEVFDGIDFPQHSTVAATFNSSAYLYGAYKDLGAHRLKKAWALAKLPDDAFLTALQAQAKDPILPLPEQDKVTQGTAP